MATKQELLDGLTQVSLALDKIGQETSSLVTKVDELEAALANVDNVPADVMALLEEVKAKVKAVDDKVQDATPTPPEPEPVDPNAPTA